jgi:hypothetical protein
MSLLARARTGGCGHVQKWEAEPLLPLRFSSG